MRFSSTSIIGAVTNAAPPINSRSPLRAKDDAVEKGEFRPIEKTAFTLAFTNSSSFIMCTNFGAASIAPEDSSDSYGNLDKASATVLSSPFTYTNLQSNCDKNSIHRA
ncbi:hypothetical protein C0992_005396 [Termitomyces sp. T32_za158]|nr:hypothetical protein C0992_005396 [Termitomyces sp. T32_za158]